MKRAETIKVLTKIMQDKEKELFTLQESIKTLRGAIREVEMSNDDTVTTLQKGTARQEIMDAMSSILSQHGPLHRDVILEKVRTMGIYVNGITTLGSYLSLGDSFKNVGKGTWTLKEKSEETDGSRAEGRRDDINLGFVPEPLDIHARMV